LFFLFFFRAGGANGRKKVCVERAAPQVLSVFWQATMGSEHQKNTEEATKKRKARPDGGASPEQENDAKRTEKISKKKGKERKRIISVISLGE